MSVLFSLLFTSFFYYDLVASAFLFHRARDGDGLKVGELGVPTGRNVFAFLLVFAAAKMSPIQLSQQLTSHLTSQRNVNKVMCEVEVAKKCI